MQAIYVYTLFDKRTGKPRCTGIRIGDDTIIRDLYRPGAGRILADVFQSIKDVRNTILVANNRNIPIVISDFKAHLKAFDIPLESEQYNAYDLHFPIIDPSDSLQRDTAILYKVLDKMVKQTPREYQKILANAAVVYEDLERVGLIYNYQYVEPVYSQRTYSGRSKTTNFNVQGLSDDGNILVWPAHCSDKHILLHFDWVCADIRAASILSGDDKLTESFLESDPYTYMMNAINAESEQKISRDECKLFLLKSINSMDFTSEALLDIYPGLGKWIRDCKHALNVNGGYLETVLGRKFRAKHAKNDLAALNGAMQGSVAHAMQLVIHKIWAEFGAKLVTEIHDSLVISCVPNPIHINYVIDRVANIMLYPFKGVLEDNPIFPVNVSIGKKWKKWKLCRTYRQNEVIRVKKFPKEDGAAQKERVEEKEAG
jgi:hypothetical protein